MAQWNPPRRPEWAGVIVRFPHDQFIAIQMQNPEVRLEVEREFVRSWDILEPIHHINTHYVVNLSGHGIRWTGHHQRGHDLWVPEQLEAGRKEIEE